MGNTDKIKSEGKEIDLTLLFLTTAMVNRINYNDGT